MLAHLKSFNLAYLSQAIINQDYHFHLFSTQIVILKLRQKAVTAVDHDRRHWKAAKVTFYHFFHYSERGQTSEEN